MFLSLSVCLTFLPPRACMHACMPGWLGDTLPLEIQCVRGMSARVSVGRSF
jgi:hypothetical protein